MPPHRAQKPNTPLSNEEQVWDVRGIGIREPEKDLKWRMQFLLHFGDSFQSNVTFGWTLEQSGATVQNFANSWTVEEKCPNRPGGTSADEP